MHWLRVLQQLHDGRGGFGVEVLIPRGRERRGRLDLAAL